MVHHATAQDGKEFAIKIFDLENPQFTKRAFQLVQEEIQATSQLDHENIVKVHEFKD